jgi:2,5-diamino-6-(ribosylamino)-4(3H)-pyrimidinone 5'-phosphate reductase
MLPFIFINIATTADGKLAPASRKFVPFGSRRDQALLLELRATADAVMSGARTVDLMPVSLGPGGAKYRRMRLERGLAEYNLRVIVSGSASLNPKAAIFKKRFSPIIVLATHAAPESRVRRLATLADEVKLFGERELDFRAATTWLREKWKVKRLLCEGGGEVNAGLFRAGLVKEVHQTICPLVFGGRNAPTLADGVGVASLDQAIRLRLKSWRRVGNELFLVHRVLKRVPR